MISNRLWKILVTFKSCKTLSATAERLFVSQPSISSSMKMLEKELGVQLFDRSKNKIVLNEVGLEAAQLAEDYLKREDFMVRQIQEKAWQMRTLTAQGSGQPSERPLPRKKHHLRAAFQRAAAAGAFAGAV